MNIPNFLDAKVTDDNGFFTPEWKIIMQQLINELQDNASNEGVVVPSAKNGAPPDNQVQIIQDNKVISSVVTTPPPVTPNFVYTCQFGTLLYDITNNKLLVALSNAGVPTFHQVVTT